MNVVLGTHGPLAKALLESASMIYGEMNVDYASLTPDMSFEGFIEEASKVLERQQGETLVLVDLFGGTPCNVFTALTKKYGHDVVAGVNLPALIEVYSRSIDDPAPTKEELVDLAIRSIGASAVHTNALLD
ncbi:PTS sugar transporter subunit IIA [Thermophilibacter sp.]|uniref:PTS sugar transporter subunit IIA n=1 Tax=Thermophilibacter sp. TaxID=2847309 RepID=UPI003A8EDBDC